MAANEEICKFKYSPQDSFEVVIITNAVGDHDGYLELAAAVKLITPFVPNSSVLWTNAPSSHKLVKGGKNYIHVFSLFKYLSNYNLNNKSHPSEYYTAKSVISDLLLGVQSKAFDPFCEIKTQLCAIQESLNEAIVTLNNHTSESIDTAASADVLKLQELFQNIHAEYDKKLTFTTDTILENIKNVKDLLCLNK